MFRLFGVLLVGLVLAGCQTTGVGGDIATSAAFRAKLISDSGIRASEYSFDVINGSIAIYGLAQSESERLRVFNHAKSLNSINEIVNYIKLEGDTNRQTYNAEIKDALMKNSLIESFNLKKKYPDILRIEIYEKRPIAILLKNKNKFYLSDKIDLIEFKNFKSEKQLPYVLGDEKIFKNFYEELKRINFPFNIAKKYTLYESNRWDIETINKKVIKLPSQNFIYSLQNYLEIKDKINFQKYKLFDYRIKNQLILK